MQSAAFKPSREMTFTTVQKDCARLLKFYRNNKQSVMVVDLSEVKQCDSAGLALLIEAKRLAKQKKRACKIIGMPKEVQALAQFCGVETILNCETNDAK